MTADTRSTVTLSIVTCLSSYCQKLSVLTFDWLQKSSEFEFDIHQTIWFWTAAVFATFTTYVNGNSYSCHMSPKSLSHKHLPNWNLRFGFWVPPSHVIQNWHFGICQMSLSHKNTNWRFAMSCCLSTIVNYSCLDMCHFVFWHLSNMQNWNIDNCHFDS